MSSDLSSSMCISSPLLPVDKAAVAYILGDGRELFQRCLQILNNAGRQDIGRGQRIGILQALVTQPEDIKTHSPLKYS